MADKRMAWRRVKVLYCLNGASVKLKQNQPPSHQEQVQHSFPKDHDYCLVHAPSALDMSVSAARDLSKEAYHMEQMVAYMCQGSFAPLKGYLKILSHEGFRGLLESIVTKQHYEDQGAQQTA
ncbi:hypothetical protein ATANTOWER_018916 [Ataeniobius toweri]|uniref:Uncharacterized protein n=1 Tax=Ataeniobius toweri TaxID=208326 RepID=A0ABU7CHG9_9TELE|nr:hypothetical protein [Ataeniobius toweri]